MGMSDSYMIIEVESYLGDTLITGKVSSIEQLRHQMLSVLLQVGEKDFVPFFCARYGFDIMPYDDYIKVDFRIDLDTHKVFGCEDENEWTP